MPRPALRFLWLLPILVLVTAVALQLYAASRPSLSLPAPILTTDIPAALPGWSAQDLPLAETEETRHAVVKTLQFDQFVSRIYRRGPAIVTIYAAYWGPNKVPPRAIGVHTPDTCWIQNGWSRLDRAHAVPLTTAQGTAFKPAEYGVYTFGDARQHVYFWHLVGGMPYSYDQEGLHSLTAPLQDLLAFGVNQRREQLFVRLASNVPFDQIWRDPGFTALLVSLGRLGVARPAGTGPSG